MARYKGFSTQRYEETGSFLLTDVELVKYDLLNHMFTRRGERVRMPNFGTTIPDLAFEMVDSDIVDLVRDEIETVIKYDPRVELLSLNVIPEPDANTITVNAVVKYVELKVVGNINFNIDFSEGG